MIANKYSVAAILALTALALSSTAMSAVNIVIQNADDPGEGFNDPTPVAPVGGNAGTTLGQQRLNAFAYTANIWGAQLTSNSTIIVQAQFNPLDCNAVSAVLGAAGTTAIFEDTTAFPKPNTWYPFALANKLVGYDIADDFFGPGSGYPHIAAEFNSNLGNPGCFTGSPFYLGLDNNVPAGQVNLVATLLHELGHGLGFQTFTSAGGSGAEFEDNDGNAFPSIWDHFLYDNTLGKTWVQMNDQERAFSTVNARKLVWNGRNVTTAAPTVLSLGTPVLTILAPSAVQGTYLAGSASFGAILQDPGESKQVGQVVDQQNGTGLACAPLGADNARRVKQRIALIDRGGCTFVVKVKNAQNAGAVGVIIVDNVAGSPPPGLSGSDPTITIPVVRVALGDGARIKAALNATSSDRSSGVVARIGANRSQLAGADELDRVMMYTPNPYQPGSSRSHWDTSTFRNQLMEPAINADLTQSVKPPEDLTLPLFRDIGW